MKIRTSTSKVQSWFDHTCLTAYLPCLFLSSFSTWETKQYKEPKGLCGKHGPKRSFPLSTKYTEATEILLFLCGGEDGRTCFAQSCRKCFFFPWKNMTWTCQGWMKALILWRGKWHDLIPLCPSCTIMFFSSISFSLISPFFCVNFYGMRFQSDAHIAWKYRIPTRFFIINIHW